ncbi:phage tail protein [Vibrio scophthalmi]|uniref:phage tail-collar fiber domain-containing protein n=1 Tax=Vibrio scophthalmi TaxID=45658 RepID=UPI00349FA18F
MTEEIKHYAVVTDIGKRLLREAYDEHRVLNLTHMALGDSNGSYVPPNIAFSNLVNELGEEPLKEGAILEHFIHVIAHVNKSRFAGKHIREIGLKDADGNLIVYAAYPETLVSDEATSQYIQLEIECIVELENTEMVNVTITPLYPLATELEAGIAKIATLEQMNAGVDDSAFVTVKKLLQRVASTSRLGVVQLSNLVTGTSQSKAATEKAVGDVNRSLESLKQSDNPFPNYWHNNETASQAEAIAGTSHSRIMTALRSMEQLKSRISNTHLGIRTDYAASESVARTIWLRADAAYSLAASKMTQALADARYVLKANVSSSITSTSTTTVANSKAVGDVNRSLESLKQSDNPFPNYWHNDETASQAEAIAGTSHSRIMTALRSMEQLKSRISNTHLGIRTDYAASESVARTIWLRADAAYSLAASKMTQATADGRYVAKSQVSSSTTSTSTTNVASSAAVKAAHDKAQSATVHNAVYNGTNPSNTNFPVGTTICAYGEVTNRNKHVIAYIHGYNNTFTTINGNSPLLGSWSMKGVTGVAHGSGVSLLQRVL